MGIIALVLTLLASPVSPAESPPNEPVAAWRQAQEADHQGRYLEALERYDAFLEAFPNHRLARSVRARAAYLEKAIGDDPEPLQRFEAVKSGFAQMGRREAVRRVEALLKDDPEFAMADEVRLWLGDRYVELGDTDAAWQAYTGLIEHHPESKLTFFAHAARGKIAQDRGDFDVALAEYQAAADSGHPGADDIAKNEMAYVRAHARRYRIYWIVLPLLIAVLLALISTIRWRQVRLDMLQSVVIEALIALPVVAVLFLLATTEIRPTIAVLTAACGAILVLSVLWAETTKPRRWKKALGVVGTALAIGGTVYVILYQFDQLVALGL